MSSAPGYRNRRRNIYQHLRDPRRIRTDFARPWAQVGNHQKVRGQKLMPRGIAGGRLLRNLVGEECCTVSEIPDYARAKRLVGVHGDDIGELLDGPEP